jgi:hypothetical protein
MHQPVQRRGRIDDHVGAEQREARLPGERRQRRLAAVELVVADGHRVVAHGVVELEVGQAIVQVEPQGALEDVAGVEQQQVAAALRLAHLLDAMPAPRDATMQRAARTVDGLDARVVVIGMQDTDAEHFRPRGNGGECGIAGGSVDGDPGSGGGVP